MNILSFLEIKDRSKVLNWQATIIKTSAQDYVVFRDIERYFVFSVHCFCHIYFNYDLTGRSHTRNYTLIVRQANSKVHMITRHSIEPTLHNQWHWLVVSSMYNF